MPTLPQEPSRPSEHEPHQYRQAAESFGSDAERYDRARPRYPEALVERIAAAGPGVDALDAPETPTSSASSASSASPAVLDILDVGCGTGIVARQFQAAGCKVTGVEPDARMAGLARRLGLDVVDVATFEAWDPAGRRFDAVVAGQAWHWIDPVAGAAKAAQVLRPGGRLAAFWNVPRLPPEVAEAFATAYQRVAPDSPFALQATAKAAPDGYQALSAKAADGIREAGGFGAPEQWRFDWEWSYTRDAWLDQMPTQGALTRLPPDKLTEVLEHVGAAIDAMGGGFTMPYVTVAVTATRAEP
ncbi:class I SAM-dependent methyltransferase [Streptomyces telluris]|uniref:Class I SAM-dependent methyltransferase n=1 Tax=Streptomyces telluris TaxID=2720021 RepID=A0A9X2LIN3_9ACTN|nr:class I SAM-dependent methyltransferase [Streptomyces telluris]MCQ8771624.1 class I SAM-dependent methyltransferase [Streptomyces telluris]NJP77207.1 class I SAM-dependent methyltransferase [Streptomyces telluris]